MLTVTVGDPSLLPVPADDLVAGGYRLAGVAAPGRIVGRHVDVLVPATVHEAHSQWWTGLLLGAERAFDLALGPVQHVLASELDLHLTAVSR